MASRSTEYRRKHNLSQVSFDLAPTLWPELFEFTGATTKRGAVEESLRRLIAARERELEWKAERDRAKAAGKAPSE